MSEKNIAKKKKKVNSQQSADPYRTSAYSVYHNGCIELLDMLCMSNHPQEKVSAAVNMIVNMRSEIRVQHEKINAARMR